MTFIDERAVQSLGWALLHFIWQGLFLAALVPMANTLTRRPQIRYAIGCALMLSMPVVFVVTAIQTHNSPAPSRQPVSIALSQDGHIVQINSAGGPIPAVHVVNGAFLLNRLSGWLVCLWLAGVLALSVSTTTGWLRVRRLTKRGIGPANPEWTESLETLIRRLHVSKPVRLCTSAIAEVPTVIGWIRPYILLPLSAVTGLTELQLRAVLAHELAHIRRHDYLVNLCQNAIETLLFYHPAVWWVGRRIRQEREHCCDDLAVEACGDVMLYANALARLEELRGSIPEPALAATGGELLARIQRLIGQSNRNDTGRIPGSAGAIMATALALAAVIVAANTPAIRAQSPTSAKPKFDVASIRRCTPGDVAARESRSSGGSRSGGSAARGDSGMLRLECRSLNNLIQSAYIFYPDGRVGAPDPGLREQPIQGTPAWAETDRYTIEAKPETAQVQQMMRGPMLQALLEERFALKFHRDHRQVPVYTLTVAKGGSRLQFTRPGSCTPIDILNQGAPPAPAPGETPPCGFEEFGKTGMDVYGWTMLDLNGPLTVALHRQILDKTGITAAFDAHFDRDFANLFTGPPNAPSSVPEDDAEGIVTGALKKLGLTIESGKAPGEFVVVDHVERPSEN